MKAVLYSAGILSCIALIVSSQTAPELAVQLQAEYEINPWSKQVTIRCAYRHYATIEWRRLLQKLPDVVYPYGPYTDGNGTLVLLNAKASDSGNYSCVAVNTAGVSSVSTYITISDPPDTQIWLSDWIIFVYCLVLWLLVSVGMVLLFCCRRKTSKQPKAPIDGDEVFVVDRRTEGESIQVETSQNYVAPDLQGFCGQGYPNPGFSTNQRVVHKTVVTNNDGTVTTITKTTEHKLLPLDPTTQFEPSSVVMVPYNPSLVMVPFNSPPTATTFEGQATSTIVHSRQKKRKSSNNRGSSETSASGRASRIDYESSYIPDENGEDIAESLKPNGNTEVIEIDSSTEFAQNMKVGKNTEVEGIDENEADLNNAYIDKNAEIHTNMEASIDQNIEDSGNTDIGLDNIITNDSGDSNAVTEVERDVSMPTPTDFIDGAARRSSTDETGSGTNQWHFNIATNVITSGYKRKKSSNVGQINSKGRKRNSSSIPMDSKLQLVEVCAEVPTTSQTEKLEDVNL